MHPHVLYSVICDTSKATHPSTFPHAKAAVPALRRDKEYMAGLAEKTRVFGAGSLEVEAYVAENYPTSGNVVKAEKTRCGECCFSPLCKRDFNNGDEPAEIGGRLYCDVDCFVRYITYRDAKNAINNPINNGTDAHYAALRRYYHKRNNRPIPTCPILHVIYQQKANFQKLLHESDGVGGTHELVKTRQYFFRNLLTGASLNILRDSPDYSHQLARNRIIQFVQDADYLVAYEPGNCDCNRLKELLGVDLYMQHLERKLRDFKRMASPVHTKVPSDSTKIYLPD
ncbi:hypothetical protein HDU80_002829, partial [Chytriomyces hyalinus]